MGSRDSRWGFRSSSVESGGSSDDGHGRFVERMAATIHVYHCHE
ncbi:hypothetical protein PF003_g37849 [Phytophthora fragariae]|nr:hypothetical protein PF003_g37849 [Phytophthora fragariae]